MKIRLTDGRDVLYQWDTGRTLSISGQCDMVHYRKQGDERSLDVEVIDGLALIPDELLQNTDSVTCWMRVGSAENGYTVVQKVFPVISRSKPNDYVFTPTEQITLEKVIKDIGNLDELIADNKDNLVDAINESFDYAAIIAEETENSMLPLISEQKESINKLKYYGDPDINISPEEWFIIEDGVLKGFSVGHKSETDIVIPYAITSIGEDAFFGCVSLASVKIPNGVTSINDRAFMECNKLENINIPNSVTSIGRGAFCGCVKLTNVNIPNSVTSIGRGAFDYILDSVTIICEKGSYAEEYAKENGIACKYLTPEIIDDVPTENSNNAITSGGVYEALSATSSTTLPTTLSINTIYDLGEQTNLSINLPHGKLGDFIQVDFLSTATPTTLTITATSGMSDYDLIPEANTIYSLYFNWIRLDADTYGWGFGYAEYTRSEA